MKQTVLAGLDEYAVNMKGGRMRRLRGKLAW
jgi:hypothetical protein